MPTVSVAASRPTGWKSPLPDPRVIEARVTNPADLGVVEAASLLQARRLSPTELLTACHDRINRRNGGSPTFDGAADSVNAWVRLYLDLAARQAKSAQHRLSSAETRTHGRAPLLCGIPVGLKDVFAVKGLPLTASSHVLDGNHANDDSTVWKRLAAAGMVLVGHTHTHEFALAVTTDQTGNPWNLALSPGGSSGGSAAALAARMVPACVGTDTAGSLRIPSSVCGTSTIKPTIGLVSNYGVVPCGYSLDHSGPMGRSAADCSLLLSYMAGPDVEDPQTLAHPDRRSMYPLRARSGKKPLAGVRLGIPTARIAAGSPEAGVMASFEQVVAECRTLGAEVVEVELPVDTVDVALLILTLHAPEISLYHEQFRSRAEKYRPSTLEKVQSAAALGTTTNDYLRAQRSRTELTEGINEVLRRKRLNALIEPTTPTVAQERGQGNLTFTAGGSVAGFTPLWAITGQPALSIPGPLTADKRLPAGVCLVGAAGEEATILQIAIDLQAHYPHHEAHPAGLA